jgi:hypothetical protein
VVIDDYNPKVPKLFIQRYSQANDTPFHVNVEDDERDFLLRRLETEGSFEFKSCWSGERGNIIESSPSLFRLDVPSKHPLPSHSVLCANCQTPLSSGQCVNFFITITL